MWGWRMRLYWQRKLEAEGQQLKLKLLSLQEDYDNSEAVQQDFVKLSQSLQVSVTVVSQVLEFSVTSHAFTHGRESA